MSTSHSKSLEQSVIAMKGYPFTRKTEFAEFIATSLGCPLLSMEDFVMYLTPPLSPEQEFEAFQVIGKIAFHHLHSGISYCVVIDSSLSSLSHLIHLKNCLPVGARVVVIECKPTHSYSWKLKFEEHLSRQTSYDREVSWFKPKRWEDVEKVVEEHPDYDVTSLSSVVNIISKLVVDPLLDCPDLYRRFENLSDLVEAVKYMMTRDQEDGPDVVIYRQWLLQHLSSSSLLGEKHCCTHGHDIVPNSAAVEGGQHDETVDCMACRRQVRRSNDTGHEYCYCKYCSLTLHMECAQFPKRRRYMASSEPFTCKPCTEGVTDKSISCKACKFTKHLQSYINCPIAIKHFDTKEHFLTILFSNNIYRCFACGENSSGEDINRSYMYLCKDCGATYHFECISLPRRVKNVHGGHHHHLSLKFESEEAEDYICQECHELRDPSLWYYSCEDCPGYELHPCCVAKLWHLYMLDGKELMDKEEIEAAKKFYHETIELEVSESISDFYSRMIYPIQWYGDSMWEEAQRVTQILGSLPLKFYHIVVAIKRSKEYESMTVDQLMIYLRVYEKRIDDGEDVLIELALANLYATQLIYYNCEVGNWKAWGYLDMKLSMNAEDEKLNMNRFHIKMSLETVTRCDYSIQLKSGDNWVKHWGKYWDNYWFNYQRGYYSNQEKSKVQCSTCYMFGHDPSYCWSVSNKAKKKPVKIKIKIKIKFLIHRATQVRDDRN